MRLLLLVDDYVPQSTKVGAKMMHELGVALVKEHHQVAVFTPDSNITSNFEKEMLDGVEVFRFRSRNVKDPSKLKRAINESILSYSAWKNLKEVIRNNTFDGIIYYSPSIFFGPLVLKLKKKWGANSYLILRDLFPQWVIDHGLIKESSPIASYFRQFEKINYRAADTIGLQSHNNLAWFQNKFGNSYNTDVLFNWTNDGPVTPNTTRFREVHGLEDKVVFFYGGNMGEAQDMMNLVRLAIQMRGTEKAHFVFAGSGNEFNLVKKAIADYKLHNLTLLEPVPQDEYSLILSECNIGLFSLHRNHSTHNFPGKLLGYMSQGLPILGSVNPGNDVIDVIEEAGAGFVSVNGEDETLLSNAMQLLENDLRELKGENASKLLKEKFTVNAAVDKIIEALTKKCELN